MDIASNLTWVALETVTAALLNTHLRDNLLETAPAKASAQGDIFYATAANAIARLAKGTKYQMLRMNSGATAPEWANGPVWIPKTADESVTSSTTLQNDNELFFAVGANEIWAFDFMLWGHGPSAANIKVDFSIPTGASARWYGPGYGTGGSFDLLGQLSVPTAFPIAMLHSTLEDWIIKAEGVLVTAGNSGTLQMQWAQNASNGTPTVVAKGSYMRCTRIS